MSFLRKWSATTESAVGPSPSSPPVETAPPSHRNLPPLSLPTPSSSSTSSSSAATTTILSTATTFASPLVTASTIPFVPDWPDQLPNEKYFGLENFGNTCYANSVLQALYFSKPFRELIESYPNSHPPPNTIITPLIKTPMLSPSLNPHPGNLTSSVPVVAAAGVQQQQQPKRPTFVQMGSSRNASAGGRNLGLGLAGGNRSFNSTFVPSGSSSSSSFPTSSIPTSPASPVLTRAGVSSPPIKAAPPVLVDPAPVSDPSTTTLLSTLHDLFTTISSQSTSTGSVAPQAFIHQLRHDNEFFRSTLHQDAHEFLGYLINIIAEQVVRRDREEEEEERVDALKDQEEERERGSASGSARGGSQERVVTKEERDKSETRKRERERSSSRRRRRVMMRGAGAAGRTGVKGEEGMEKESTPPTSGVHELFEGILTNETRCLTCETVTSRDESFLDLSIDIEPNSSVTSCLKQFSASEMLCQRNKFSCDRCCGLQEAEKRMKIKKLPNILALHLKRFKYEESLQRHVKLTYRVVFPFELRLFNTASNVADPDRLYELWAIIVHIGLGPHHGHYITIVKSGKRWIVFDDNTVLPIEEKEIQKYFGDTPGQGSGYVLFYQAVDLIDHQRETKAANGDFKTTNTTTTNGLGLEFNPRKLSISTSTPPPNAHFSPTLTASPSQYTSSQSPLTTAPIPAHSPLASDPLISAASTHSALSHSAASSSHHASITPSLFPLSNTATHAPPASSSSNGNGNSIARRLSMNLGVGGNAGAAVEGSHGRASSNGSAGSASAAGGGGIAGLLGRKLSFAASSPPPSSSASALASPPSALSGLPMPTTMKGSNGVDSSPSTLSTPTLPPPSTTNRLGASLGSRKLSFLSSSNGSGNKEEEKARKKEEEEERMRRKKEDKEKREREKERAREVKEAEKRRKKSGVAGLKV